MDPTEIYSFLIDKITLTEQHKNDLIVKRGLSEKTIIENKFRSSTNELIKIEDDLRVNFKEQDLIKSGIFIKSSTRSSQINPILLENRILIPYLSPEGKVYHLRPHKLGFTDIKIQIYQEYNLSRFEDRSEIILTEGEFKATAGVQYQIPSIGIPGITSFSETHFSRLIDFLNKYEVKRIIILFDNEVKDDPRWAARYKENPNDRYDTLFYAYYMAYKLEKENFETRIGWLPDGWRTEGKVDLDGACALKKSRGDILKILFDSKSYRDFLKSLNKEAANCISRKMNQKFHRSKITRDFGHYVASRARGKTIIYEIISNFLIKILATHETTDGIVREIIFISENNQTSDSFSASSQDIASCRNFTEFCLNKGNYIWRGTQEDLMTIWEDEFLMMDEGRRIIEPDHIGWFDQEKMWIFGNVAIDKTGAELRPDRNRTFWIEKKGIKAVPLSMAMGRNLISDSIPCLQLTEFDINEALERLSDTIGMNEAKQCLGWISAIPFMEEIYEHYSCFPFLFVTGRRGCGKSSIAEWFMNFFGLDNSGKMASETTPVAIQRYLSYYSCLPVFIDEYRNTEQIKYKTGLFRNAYNRQSAGKGMKEGWGIREGKIRGTLILVGEETPEDNALLTRCIPIVVYQKNRIKNHFSWFQASKLKFSNHILNLIKKKTVLMPIYFRILEEARNYFIQTGKDERMSINYSIITAGYAIAFGEKDIDFAKWISDETGRIQTEFNEEQPVSVFFNYLDAMKTKGIVDGRYWHYDEFTRHIYLYFEGLYNEYSQEYRKTRGIIPFKKAAIRSYLKEETGFLDISCNHQLSGDIKSCILFDMDKAPDFIKLLTKPKQTIEC